LDAVVFGAGGQLGREIVRELTSRGLSVLDVDRRHLNITIETEVDDLLERHSPRWAINCAAYNQVDHAEAEPATAMAVNAIAVRDIAKACTKYGSTLLHYSTDHVFDGRKHAPYVEEDLPAPPSAYGISKLAGEHFARAFCVDAYVIRVAGVFGPEGTVTRHGNFPELIYKRTSAGESLKIVDDFFATPTYAPALAARSIDLLQNAPAGTYHIGGSETVSWYQWARKIVNVAGLPENLVQPIGHQDYPTPAQRPQHASLSNAKAEALGIAPMPPLDEAAASWLALRNKIAAEHNDLTTS
jgi:dTDP-4-dehydrorhamnose reductase